MYTGTQWFSDMMNASALFPGGWFVLNISTVRVMGMIRPIQHWNHSVFRLLAILQFFLRFSFLFVFLFFNKNRNITFCFQLQHPVIRNWDRFWCYVSILQSVWNISQHQVSGLAFWFAQFSITKWGLHTCIPKPFLNSAICNLKTITEMFHLGNEQFNIAKTWKFWEP